MEFGIFSDDLFAPDVTLCCRMSARGGKKKTTKLSRSARAGVIFPVGRMMRYLRTGTHKYRIGMGAPVYMAAVIEYLAGKHGVCPYLLAERLLMCAS